MEILVFLGFVAAIVVVAAVSLAKRARWSFRGGSARRGNDGDSRNERD